MYILTLPGDTQHLKLCRVIKAKLNVLFHFAEEIGHYFKLNSDSNLTSQLFDLLCNFFFSLRKNKTISTFI
jgi:hypothetical protein